MSVGMTDNKRDPRVRLTDEEVLCEFMEPKNGLPDLADFRGDFSPGGWWITDWHPLRKNKWLPRRQITLNECHEIEGRLTEDQWRKYETALSPMPVKLIRLFGSITLSFIHADAQTKIKALAEVLRAEVEAK